MRILGIDPGYAILGYGIVDFDNSHYDVAGYGAVTTDKNQEMSMRLKHLYSEISNIIDLYKPDAVAVEELFFNKNAKTAILVAQARGAVITACVNKGLPLYEYTPLQIKQALAGYGRADKQQVQYMVKLILHLNEVPKPDDTADALAVAVCHGNSSNASGIFRIDSGV
ncbi:MAG: crossover junction endodeoxyribonuclease RuvC [Firmicutes bacterium]|nr:crossover junction endodeoxyribonuclease RuvC [Bacillota bacterium]